MNSTLSDLDRLTEISRYDFTDPRLRAALDAIATRTAELLEQPISLITILLDNAQIFIGSHGLQGWPGEVGGTPAEWSFCARMVETHQPYAIGDATHDPRQHDNPLVTMDGIRSYAGAPLIAEEGQVIGGHCVLGAAEHRFTEEDIAYLRGAADRIMEVMKPFRAGAQAGPQGTHTPRSTC